MQALLEHTDEVSFAASFHSAIFVLGIVSTHPHPHPPFARKGQERKGWRVFIITVRQGSPCRCCWSVFLTIYGLLSQHALSPGRVPPPPPPLPPPFHTPTHTCQYFGEFVTSLRLRVPMQVLLEHTDEVWFVAFSHSGRMLASASKDRSAIIWDVRPGQRRVDKRCVLLGHTEVPPSPPLPPWRDHTRPALQQDFAS